MENLLTDVRQTLRSLGRRPAFCAVVILTLALGIGANSAIFTVVDTVLLKPLPYRAPDRLVMIWSKWINFDKTWLSEAEYVDYKGMTSVFDGAAAFVEGGDGALTGPPGPESAAVAGVTGNFFDVLGVSAIRGRTITPDDAATGRPSVAMISWDLWQRRFGGDNSVIGRLIQLNGSATEVIGVLPRAFRLPTEFQTAGAVQLLQPIAINETNPQRGSHYLYGVARLKPGAIVSAATAEIRANAERRTAENLYPAAMHFTAFAVPLRTDVTGNARIPLLALWVAVGFLLLLTCANVANLALTRADARHREIAVRTALGAGKWPLVRLVLTESMVLSLAGGVVGLGLAWAGVKLLVLRAPTSVPRLAELTVDWRMVALAFLLSIVTGILFGAVPAWRMMALDPNHALRDGSRGVSGGREKSRARGLLVATEMALAALLVIGAGLTTRSLINLLNVAPGFDARNVFTVGLSLPAVRYDSSDKVIAFYQTLGDRVRATPGVVAAGFVRQLPLATEIGDAGMAIEGRPAPGPNEQGMSADWQVVTPGYLETMRERLVRGRFFDSTDTPTSLPVIAVNEQLVREYFRGQDALGQRIRVGGPAQPWRTIVGIVGDVHHNGLTSPVKRKWFLPHNQWGTLFGNPRRSMTLVVRTAGDPLAALAPITALVRQMDPDLPLTRPTTMAEVLAGAMREQRFTMALMAGFALLALVLAAVGIYGVISYSVGQRTREIGIRLALGADGESVRRLVLTQGMKPAVIGIGVGVVAAFGLTRYIGAMLYGVAPVDSLTFGTIPLLLLAVAIAAVLIPAARASRVDPIEALRAE